jgi:hydroxyacylglutathione hydrolase
MLIKCLTVGPIQANCYLVWDEATREALVIDPGDEGSKILTEINNEQLKVKYIVNTHGHMDHISANACVKEATGAKLLIHIADAPYLQDTEKNLSAFMGNPGESSVPDQLLNGGEELRVGSLIFTVFPTPGHTPGGISLKTAGVIFTGDALFRDSIGRTDFPGGDYAMLIKSILEQIMPLEDQTAVYPGHGPATTVGYERAHNPYL